MKAKNLLKWLGVTITVLIIGFIVFNQFDISDPVILYTEKDLRPVTSDDSENGYFLILGFTRPADVDPMSPDSIKGVRDEIKHSVENLTKKSDDMEPRKSETQVWNIVSPVRRTGNFVDEVFKQREEILTQKKTNLVLLSRLEKLLKMEKVEDIWPPIVTYEIPKFYIIQKVIDIYIAEKLLNVSKTGFRSFEDELTSIFFLGGKVAQSGRMYITALIGYSFQKNALTRWAYLMEWDKFPAVMLDVSINKLTGLKSEIPSIKNAMIGEYLMSYRIIQTLDSMELDEVAVLGAMYPNLRSLISKLTYQKNRTSGYLAEYTKILAERHNIPPYKREEFVFELKMDRPLWWLQNYGGKILEAISIPSMERALSREYEVKAMLDLTLLSAYLHKEKVEPAKVQGWLNLKFEKGYINPFTGKAYEWDEESRFVTCGKNAEEYYGVRAQVPYLKEKWPEPQERKTKRK